MNLTRREFAAAALVGVAGCVTRDGGQMSLEGDDVLPVPVLGDPDAGVTVMVFEDFGCPGCQQFKQGIFPSIEDAYIESEQIRYEHRDFPVPADDTWSYTIAGAARSVQEQGGDEAFWEFANEIYDHQASYSGETVIDVANSAGVDGEQVLADAEDGTYRDDLEAERDRAEDAGVSSTPTVVVDGTTVDATFDNIRDAIEDAL